MTYLLTYWLANSPNGSLIIKLFVLYVKKDLLPMVEGPLMPLPVFTTKLDTQEHVTVPWIITWHLSCRVAMPTSLLFTKVKLVARSATWQATHRRVTYLLLTYFFDARSTDDGKVTWHRDRPYVTKATEASFWDRGKVNVSTLPSINRQTEIDTRYQILCSSSEPCQ